MTNALKAYLMAAGQGRFDPVGNAVEGYYKQKAWQQQQALAQQQFDEKVRQFNATLPIKQQKADTGWYDAETGRMNYGLNREKFEAEPERVETGFQNDAALKMLGRTDLSPVETALGLQYGTGPRLQRAADVAPQAETARVNREVGLAGRKQEVQEKEKTKGFINRKTWETENKKKNPPTSGAAKELRGRLAQLEAEKRRVLLNEAKMNSTLYGNRFTKPYSDVTKVVLEGLQMRINETREQLGLPVDAGQTQSRMPQQNAPMQQPEADVMTELDEVNELGY